MQSALRDIALVNKLTKSRKQSWKVSRKLEQACGKAFATGPGCPYPLRVIDMHSCTRELQEFQMLELWVPGKVEPA